MYMGIHVHVHVTLCSQPAFFLFSPSPLHTHSPTHTHTHPPIHKPPHTHINLRWKLHSNWVSEVRTRQHHSRLMNVAQSSLFKYISHQVHYFAALRCFASCSCDSVSSLVLGEFCNLSDILIIHHVLIVCKIRNNKFLSLHPSLPPSQVPPVVAHRSKHSSIPLDSILFVVEE